MNRIFALTSLIAILALCACTTRAELDRGYVKNTSKILVEKSIEYMADRKYDEALEILNRAVEFDPDNDLVYACRSTLFLTLNDKKRAIEEANKALSINRKNEYAYTNRAHVLISFGEYEQAIHDCNSALKYNNRFYPAMGNRGVAEYYSGDLKNAVRDLTVSIEKMPDEQIGRLLYIRSLCFTRMGREILAKRDLTRSEELGFLAQTEAALINRRSAATGVPEKTY